MVVATCTALMWTYVDVDHTSTPGSGWEMGGFRRQDCKSLVLRSFKQFFKWGSLVHDDKRE